MIAYKVVRVVDGKLLSAWIKKCAVEYAVGEFVHAPKGTALAVFDTIQHARDWETRLFDLSDVFRTIYKVEATKSVMQPRTFFMTNSNLDAVSVRRFWRHWKKAIDFPWKTPQGTIFCTKVKLLHLI